MIKLKVLNTPDKDKIGINVFYKNLIYIGSNYSSDLYIHDELIVSNHLIIEIVDSRLILHKNKSISSILINGKINTGHKVLNIGNKIKIGHTEFAIEDFSFTQRMTLKEKLNDLTEKFIQEDSPVLDLLSKIQESKHD